MKASGIVESRFMMKTTKLRRLKLGITTKNANGVDNKEFQLISKS